MPVKDEKAVDKGEEHLSFHYLKSPLYRTLHADGAWGGVTPRGLIHMTLYSERGAVPRRTVSVITSEGVPGEEVLSERESREGVVRELEVGVMLDPLTAKAVAAWLNERADAIFQLQNTPVQPPKGE